ncbi:hypothetical protein AA313_de0205221 [Arthrobotrys entomopaga]|nr:hypothetical protein AA313_de0205221 [Arthrobotrys entomopaga]
MNVLVYSGSGTTIESVKHCIHTFQRLLSPHYAVSSITADAISRGQWLSTCALLCLPGGADLGFCKALNGQGNRYIKQYVRRGGRYIGFCAGAYFASADIQFEKGNQSLEVTGSRELAFFPGSCHGAAYRGFSYDSEAGARVCTLNVTGMLLEMGSPEKFKSYYNGGGIFVDAEKFKEQGIEILAKYQDSPELECKGDAAAIGCKIGAGYAFLISTHPEYDAGYLRKTLKADLSTDLIDALEADESSRVDFLKTLLKLLGLKFSNQETVQPILSDLYLSFSNQASARDLTGKLTKLTGTQNNRFEQKIIVGEHDIFLIEDQSVLVEGLVAGCSDLPGLSDSEKAGKSIFRIKIPERCHHSVVETPYFNGAAYFKYLATERTLSTKASRFGSPLLYGEIVTSTSTLLENNFRLLQQLPSGFTFVATRQTAARGRGNNSWVSPMGALVFSTLIRYRLEHCALAPVVFIQYLAALSIVVSIKTYSSSYRDFPVFIKWPNDIYAGDPSAQRDQKSDRHLRKIGGILVNANLTTDEFLLVIGCGLNVKNEAPTTSLDKIAESIKLSLPGFENERLLAKIITTFETYYERFKRFGFGPFEKDYYRHWLHRDQVVLLHDSGTKTQIQGISLDDGMLIANELDEYGRFTGKSFKLQTDGNSFDFFNGLIFKKAL